MRRGLVGRHAVESLAQGLNPQTLIQGSRRSSRDPYWVYTSGGHHTIRMHLRPHRAGFVPTSATTGQSCEPRLDLLGEQGSTHGVYNETGNIIFCKDNRKRSDSYRRLTEPWLGETIL